MRLSLLPFRYPFKKHTGTSEDFMSREAMGVFVCRYITP